MDVETLQLNRYPDPQQLEMKALLAEMRGVRPEQIFVGVGSDEAIDLLIRIFCCPGKDTILITPPTYGMYKVRWSRNGCDRRPIRRVACKASGRGSYCRRYMLLYAETCRSRGIFWHNHSF